MRFSGVQYVPDLQRQFRIPKRFEHHLDPRVEPAGTHDDIACIAGRVQHLQARVPLPCPIGELAPIAAGQPLGKLLITSSSGSTEVPLVAGAAVEPAGFFGHILATLKYLIFPQG